tara:strand:- start:3477 stop:3968 length:492 start_codon:yes stop_codon:yes gene_type:complete
MRIFFAISALLWSWLVGRCLAVGINIEIFKLQEFNADSWYNLTLLRRRIPPLTIKYSPILMGILSIPILLIDDDLLHCVAVIALVSEHCYIPMFIARINKTMSLWVFANILLNIVLACLLKTQWIIFWQLLKILLLIWYLSVELQLGDNIVYEIEESGRQPRV